jgi:MFS family permease
LQVHADGHPTAVYGGLLALSTVLVLGGELPLTRLTRRLPRPAMAAGLPLVGAGFAVNALARAVLPLICGVLIWTLGEMLVFPIANGYWAEYASVTTRGRYAGAYSMAWAVANSLTPALGGAAFARNPSALWLSCGMLGVAAATLLLGSAPRTAPP